MEGSIVRNFLVQKHMTPNDSVPDFIVVVPDFIVGFSTLLYMYMNCRRTIKLGTDNGPFVLKNCKTCDPLKK
jgi:hypothetical protein